MEPGFPLRVLGLFAAVAALALATCSGAFAWNAIGPSGTESVHVPDNAATSDFCPTFSQEGMLGIPGCGHLQFNFTTTGMISVFVTLDCSSLPDPTTCSGMDVNPALCLENAPAGSTTGTNCPASSTAPNAQGLEAQTATTADGVSNCVNTVPDHTNADGSITWRIDCNVVPGSYELVIAGNPLNTCDPNDLINYPICSATFGGPGANAIVSWNFSAGSMSIGLGSYKVMGGGQVLDNTEQFASYADQNRLDHTLSIFHKHTRTANCFFFAYGTPDSLTITPNLLFGGGDATIKGTGKVWTWQQGWQTVPYTVHLHDSGQKTQGDTYSLDDGGVCDTGGVAQPLRNGDIRIDKSQDRSDT